MQPLNIPQKNTQTLYLKSDDYTFVTGDQLYFTVKTKPDDNSSDTTALIKKNWTVGTDASYDDDGYLNLNLAETDTNVAAGEYVYDIKLKNASVAETLVFGPLNILPVATLRA